MTHAVDQRGPHTLLERPPRCAPSAFLRAAVSIGDGKVSPRRPDPRGVRLLRKLDQDIARQEAANQALREENARLQRRVRALSAPMDRRVLEKEAREQLGFVRPDEVLVKFE